MLSFCEALENEIRELEYEAYFWWNVWRRYGDSYDEWRAKQDA